MKPIQYSKQATKALAKMPAATAKRIIAAINAYTRGEKVDARPMAGSPNIRLRVGGWRVIINDSGMVLLVLRIGSRGDIYKGR